MGRSIKKKWFGVASQSGAQIIVGGAKWADGTTDTNAYIVKQVGAYSYIVSNGTTKTETLFLANATTTGALTVSTCFITVTVFGSGAVLPVSKIMQYRVNIFEANGTIGSYTWSTQPASVRGQVDLITLAELGAPVNTAAPVVSPATGTNPYLMTSTNGTWTGNPTIAYTYQWTLAGTNIVGATSSTYTTTGTGTYACVVTATNGIGSSTATSNNSVAS